ncbi:MAG: hypothetical protein Q8922_04620 [Bacteroidota bacterium]|nr:hypothetical protein [Bacteroidota bacterium]MDP4287202.1 hypothetical protein [Bacteroidota bacterium]
MICIVVLGAGCESGVDTPYVGPRMSLAGSVRLVSLTGVRVPMPYRDVTVSVLTINGGGYYVHADTTGHWIFKNIAMDDYNLFAAKDGYGTALAADATGHALAPVDSMQLVLGEAPTVQPVFDSIVGSRRGGLGLYATMPDEEGAALGFEIRHAGEPDSLFSVWAYSSFVQRVTGNHWFAWFDSSDLVDAIVGMRVRAVAYNPVTGVYFDRSYPLWRFSSPGAPSNVLTIRQ